MSNASTKRPSRTDRPILTAAEMRAAEQAAIDAGTSVETLMERAGAAAAEAVWRFAGPMPVLVLCGPGNNGGDGYVIARYLKARGADVRVAAIREPQSPAALQARGRWDGPVGDLPGAQGAPLLVDALFGTGLTRSLSEEHAAALVRLAGQASVRVAIDLPSGAATDDGVILSPVPDYDLTVALGALKPSHLLQPAARHMGRLVVADIGVEAQSLLHVVTRPVLRKPGPDDHKYKRGYVAVVAGDMPGASGLAAAAAQRAGAGYVRLASHKPVAGIPQAIVQGGGDLADCLKDVRIGAVVTGPGLGRGPQAEEMLGCVLAAPHPLVLDADALMLLGGTPERLRDLSHQAILSPHAGEFSALFGSLEGSKVEQARRAAVAAGAILVFKGSDTVIAAADGRAAIASPALADLASAGTGDVLAGIVAAMRASGLDAFEAACAGVWLHGRAAEVAGPGLIADDLIPALAQAVSECR